MLPRLPKLLTLEQMENSIPKIEPLPSSASRPIWSVMIPTYKRPDYLRKTLESVLAQAPGTGEMQIRVMDNGSDIGDIEQLVSSVGGDRVEYFRQPKNVGYLENIHACIQNARGTWVHLLHDDDMVMPGFYEAYKEVILTDPALVMVFGQVQVIDEKDQWLHVYGPQPPSIGVRVVDFAERQAFASLVNVCGAVAKRTAYEKTGGYSSIFPYMSDVEMWFRIGLTGPVGMVGKPYALRRVHGGSGTTDLSESAAIIKETYVLTALNILRTGKHPPPGPESGLTWRESLAKKSTSERAAWRQENSGSTVGRLNYARMAWLLSPSFL